MKRSVVITALVCPLLISAAATAQTPPPPSPAYGSLPPYGYGYAAPYPYAYTYAPAPPPPPPRKGPPESVPAIIAGSSLAGGGVLALVASLFVVVAGTQCQGTPGLLSIHCSDTQTARDVAGALAVGGLAGVAIGVPLIVYGAQRKPARVADVRVGASGLSLTARF